MWGSAFNKRLVPFFMNWLIAGAMMLCLNLPASSQVEDYYQLQLFDHSYGIRPGSIIDVARDQQGFVWVLYPKFIQRFDGNECVTYEPGPRLERICIDSTGRVWLIGGDEIMKYNFRNKEFEKIRIDRGENIKPLSKIIELPGHAPLLHSSSGFFEWSEVDNIFQPVLLELAPLPPYSGRSVEVFGSSCFLVARNHIFRSDFNRSKVDSLKVVDGLFRFFPIGEDSLLVTTWELESFWYDFKNLTVTSAVLPSTLQDSFSPYVNVRSAVAISPHEYIMAAREGLLKFNSKRKTFEALKIYMKGKLISTKDYTNSLFIDAEMNLWMAAIDGVGKVSLREHSFGLIRMAHEPNPVPYGIDNIRGICTDANGNFWLATGNGIARLNYDMSVSKIYEPIKNSETSLGHPSVRGIAFDGKYVVIAPTNKGIWLFDPVSEKFIRPNYQSEDVKQADRKDFYDAIYTLRNGNILCLGRDALYELNTQTLTLSFVNTPASNENCNYAWQGPGGEIWLATQKGLHLLDEKLRYIQKAEIRTANKFIHGGAMLKDGRLLFSVEDGVFAARYAGGNITFQKFSPAFDGIAVRTLVEDNNHIIWATSDNGVYRFDPNDQSIRLFDISDNVQGYGFNGNSWTITSGGYLLLGGMNGINFIKTDKLDKQTTQLQIYLDRVTAGSFDSIDISNQTDPVLPWSNRSISFHIVCPFFNNPDKVVFRYKLKGFDSNWKYLEKNRLLRFASLPAGQYKLQLEGSIDYSTWVPAANAYSFIVAKPFWMTLWFVTSCLFLLGLIIYFYIRGRNRVQAEQREEFEAEQAIHYFSQQISEKQTIFDLLWDVAQNCIGRLRFEDCVIYQVNQVDNTIYQVAAIGPKNPTGKRILNPLVLKLGEGISGYVASTGVGEIIEDTRKDPRYIPDGQSRLSEIAVPILIDGKVVGVIDCENSKKGFFKHKHLNILNTIASLCSARMVKINSEGERLAAVNKLLVTQQQMAEAEMQALRAQMNPHFIFNCLNSINRYIIKSDQTTASLYLTRFAKLIRLILDNSNSHSISLSNDLEALKLYIDMESIRFDKRFDFSISVNENVQPDHVHVPPLLIQPYVENAIWHGLLNKGDGGKLDIRISRIKADLLMCTIEDNGIGREASRALQGKTVSRQSLGMKVTKKRLDILNHRSGGNASVKIDDLYDESGAPAGTRIILQIPIDTLNE